MKKSLLRNTLLAAMIASISGGAGAAGLGRINVLSSLGQPLRAEVEIAATPDELEAMSAKVATPEAHARANIEYAGELTAVRMSIERRAGGGAVVKISSDRAFNEPFVDMLVELNWGGGRILREYTFLLDPTEAAAVKPLPQISEPAIRSEKAPVGQASSATPKTARAAEPATAPRSAKPAKAATAERTAAAPVSTEKSGDYTVRQGDSASSIATRLKPVEVTRDQMMAALYQNNQSEFGGGNINRLRVGQVLKVPTAAEAAAIDKAEARQIIVKASSFEGLKQEVGATVAKGPAKEAANTQTGSGKVAPKVEEKAASTAQSKDQLKISKAPGDKAAGAADGSKAASRIQTLEEDVAAREKALKEANSRTAELEKNVKELEKLVQMKSQSLADLQKQAEAGAKAAVKMTKAEKAAAEKAEKTAAAEKAKAEKLAAAEQAKADKLAAEEKIAADLAAAEKAAQENIAAEKAAAEAAVAPSAPIVDVASAPASAVEPSTPPVQAPAPVVAAALPAAEDDSGIFANPLTLGALGLAVLGAGYVVLRNRRRSNANSGMTSMSEVSTSPNSVFGNAGGQTVDTGTSVLHTDFSQSGLSAIDTDEGVDPVAEADVYMAYGRDAQAEEILLDALKNDPSRIAIYLKLLEIYAQRRSVKQFENIATDLFTQTGGAGDDWAKAGALGARLDPGNPLYGSSNNTTVIIPPEVVPAAAPVAPAPEPAPAAPIGVSFGTNNVSQMRATWTVPGEISQFTGAGDNDAPLLAPEPPEDLITTSPEPLNLDFNLDLELPEGEEPETQIEARKEDDVPLAPKPVASAPLEFDLDMDPFGAQPVSTPVAASQHLAAEAAVDQAMQALSETDADMGIERAMDRTSLSVVDLEKTNFESSLLDFDFELGEDTNVSRSNMDLSDISLRTDAGLGQAPAPTPSRQQAEVVDTAAASRPAVGSIDVHDEVSTKLELARAYEEMGDVEGARELLEEVMADGADQQRQMAQAILARIA
ncbi:MAG TPA: FimV/HubP family polar landmark protein [Rhodocyclaceae bacterium]|nr:FimV/HubP family polar landmark protein [Rhodocyclaceae bacterium]